MVEKPPFQPVTAKAEPSICEGRLGEKPWWMSADQYDASGGQCRCVLPVGHIAPCVCEHTRGDDR